MVQFRTRKKDKRVFPVNQQLSQRTMSRPSIIGRIKGIKEKLRQRREAKGLQRIESDKLALEKEKITAERLKKELEVEQAREKIAQETRETQEEFKKIERAKRERKFAPFKKVISRAVETGKAIQKRTTPPKKSRSKKATRQETGFFEADQEPKKKKGKEIGAFGIEF